MRYRVHKHCRALDCRQWVVSRTRDHVAIFWAADQHTAMRLACGQVDRDRMIREAHANPIFDVSKWVNEATEQWRDMQKTFMSAVADGRVTATRLSPVSEIVGTAFDIGSMSIDIWSPAEDGRSAVVPMATTEPRGLGFGFAGSDLLKSSKLPPDIEFQREVYAVTQQTWVPADNQNPEID